MRLGHPPRGERRVDAEAGVEEACGHGFGEVGGDSLRGGSVGCGELRDLEEELVRFLEVVRGDGFRALEEESEEMETFLVLFLSLDLFFSLSQRLRRVCVRYGGGHRLWRRWRVLPFLLLNRRRRRRFWLLLLLLLCYRRRKIVVLRFKRWRRRWSLGGRRVKKHEGTESVLEKSTEVWVTREDDVSNVLDKLRDGDGGRGVD